MKLQVAAGQLRLRLSEAELASLVANVPVREAMPCPNGRTANVSLALQADDVAGQCTGDLLDLHVVLPRDAFLAFAAERPRRDGFTFACGAIDITVEIDVRDSHRLRRIPAAS